MSGESLFRVDDLVARYGTLQVLHGVSLTLAPGARVGIFGHNGSGKSTLLKCLVGGVPDCTGTVRYLDQEVVPGAVHRNVRLGIGMVRQTRNVFPTLSVDENLVIAGHTPDAMDRTEIYAMFPRLAERRRQRAGSMSGGEQQMLAVGMALMTRPRAILLDEPTAGLSPVAVSAVLDSLVEVGDRAATAIVLVEQNVMAALRIVERAIVVRSGEVVYDGGARALSESVDLWSLF
jgi:branched-chain amino acid transport system ATP-binding protein